MSFFQLFQHRLGSGKRTIGDFSSEQLLHDPVMKMINYVVGDSDDDDDDDDGGGGGGNHEQVTREFSER